MDKRRILLLILLPIGWFACGAQGPSPGTLAQARAELFKDKGGLVLKKEASGIHPRLFIGPEDLAAVQNHFAQDPAFFQSLLPAAGSKALRLPGVTLGKMANSMDEREGMMAVGPTITRLTVLYRITKEEKYWEGVKRWAPVLGAMQPIDIKEDLVVGYFLYNISISYDMMKGAVDTVTEGIFRRALIAQARDTYAAFQKRERFPFEQNHLIIPVSALGLAAMALLDDPELRVEARQWLVFAQNVLDISLDAIGWDGWFFEGIGYWSFTIPFPLAYAGALKRVTGENLLDKPLFRNAGLYLEHMFLPHPDFVFDFEDWGPRAEGNSFQKGYDWPWHTLPTRVNSLFLLPHEVKAPYMPDIFFLLEPLDKGLLNDDRCATFAALWQQLVPGTSTRIKDGTDNVPYHYFPDMEVLHWRSSWGDSNATALAFKSGPPGGHHITELYHRHPEEQSGLGHAHPDMGSFILYSKGVFLANATGYTIKESRWQNTITVDGKSQGEGGLPWTTWAHFPYDSLNKIHLEKVWLSSGVAAAKAVFAGAYNKELRVRQMDRSMILVGGRWGVILDEIRSDSPHVYDWFLHTDRAPEPLGPDVWKMENGPARLVIRNFTEARAGIAPTIVETEFYDLKKTRPQQRGFHLNLRSPRQKEGQFLTALCIQDRSEKAEAFHATRIGDGCIELASGKDSCWIWIGPQADLDGDFGYLLKTKDRIREIGFSGRRLTTAAGTFSLPARGQVILHPGPKGEWKEEGTRGPVSKIIISNSRGTDRVDEIVSLKRSAFGSIPEGRFPLLLEEGRIPLFQLYDSKGDQRWDELLVNCSIKAFADKTFSVRWVKKEELPLFGAATNVRLSKRSLDGLPTPEITREVRTRGFVQNIAAPYYQMEGPGIENDKVAFRAFFDYRNTKDIYGKITERMVLDMVGVAHPWHTLQDWGMDIYPSAKTLGAGGLAVMEDHRLYGLGDADSSSYEFLDKGPLKAGFRLTFKNWDMGSGKGDGSEEMTMEKGDFFYRNDIRAPVTARQALSIGLGKIGLDTFYHRVLNDRLSALYCYGNQAAGTGSRLGTAILFSTEDFLGTGVPPEPGWPGVTLEPGRASGALSLSDSITHTCYVLLKPRQEKEYRVYFVAGWEKTDPRFASQEGFERYLSETAERLGYPLQSRFIK